MGLNITQQKILALILEGKTNSEIADKLNYSESNVLYHIKKIYKHYKIPDKNTTTKRTLLVKIVTAQELERFM